MYRNEKKKRKKMKDWRVPEEIATDLVKKMVHLVPDREREVGREREKERECVTVLLNAYVHVRVY